MVTNLREQFIVLYGIDGTGKTTTAQSLTSRYNELHLPVINYDEYEKTLSPAYRQIKKIVKTQGSPEEQLAFTLASSIYHSHQISQLVESGYTVIKSRYLLDVAAHHSHLGAKNVEQIISLFPFFAPSLQVILLCDELTRQSRIAARGEKNEKDLIKKEPGTRADYFEKYLLEHAQNTHVFSQVKRIDTTNSTPTEVAEQIVSNQEDHAEWL